MIERAYDFHERINMSQGVCENASVEKVLLAKIPGSLKVIQASTENDRNGTDWWVEMSTSRFLSVDAKVRQKDFSAKPPGADDLALETWSVKGEKLSDGTRSNNRIIGWTRNENKRTDYIIWLWKDTGRFCIVPFPMLCKVFSEHWETWSRRYKCVEQFTPRGDGGWWSECVFVDRREVWAEIYRTFAPNPIPEYSN